MSVCVCEREKEREKGREGGGVGGVAGVEGLGFVPGKRRWYAGLGLGFTPPPSLSTTVSVF